MLMSDLSQIDRDRRVLVQMRLVVIYIININIPYTHVVAKHTSRVEHYNWVESRIERNAVNRNVNIGRRNYSSRFE